MTGRRFQPPNRRFSTKAAVHEVAGLRIPNTCSAEEAPESPSRTAAFLDFAPVVVAIAAGASCSSAPSLAGPLAALGPGPSRTMRVQGMYFSIASTTKNKAMALEFMKSYIMNQSYIEFISQNGYIPPVKNSSSYVDDPMMKKMAETFENAGHVQVYYDQFLPPAMGEKHKDLVQSLFGLKITPEEVAKAHEEAILEELNK